GGVVIVRTLQDIVGTDRDVDGGNWSSRRLSLADDGMGFSMHDTVLRTGTETHMWYKNHLEGVYCIEGKATLEDKATGEVHEIRPGTIYLLNDHDRHVLRVEEDLRVICTFNPPVTGGEVHDEDGAYPLLTPED
ncbi:MAG TPA: ectoine synthase, partial [Acidimicrobiales bacterium]|nr:ectoine synthase [Acidimicrobiales bacterium]